MLSDFSTAKPQKTRAWARHEPDSISGLVYEAAEPGGWCGLVYHRPHGAPKVYHSAYPDAYLNVLARRLAEAAVAAPVWCVFNNTALGAATVDALTVLVHKPADAFRF